MRVLDDGAGNPVVHRIRPPDGVEHVHQLVEEASTIGAGGASRHRPHLDPPGRGVRRQRHRVAPRRGLGDVLARRRRRVRTEQAGRFVTGHVEPVDARHIGPVALTKSPVAESCRNPLAHSPTTDPAISPFHGSSMSKMFQHNHAHELAISSLGTFQGLFPDCCAIPQPSRSPAPPGAGHRLASASFIRRQDCEQFCRPVLWTAAPRSRRPAPEPRRATVIES